MHIKKRKTCRIGAEQEHTFGSSCRSTARDSVLPVFFFVSRGSVGSVPPSATFSFFSRAVRLVRFRDFFSFFLARLSWFGSAGFFLAVCFFPFPSVFLSRVSVFLSRGSVPPVFFLFPAVCFFRFLFFLVVPLFFSLAFFLFFPSQPYTKSK
jgi:hypothetical protein